MRDREKKTTNSTLKIESIGFSVHIDAISFDMQNDFSFSRCTNKTQIDKVAKNWKGHQQQSGISVAQAKWWDGALKLIRSIP